MRHIKETIFLLFMLSIAVPSGICQLRNLSKYDVDQINIEETHFILYDTGSAEFVWSSEWTHMTAYANDGRSAILIWHFNDGSKAYTQQGKGIGEFGKNTGYLITDQAPNLEDIQGKKIQPMTLNNYPVKVELWIGDVGENTGYSPEVMGDEVCFDAPNIEYNISYKFSGCPLPGP